MWTRATRASTCACSWTPTSPTPSYGDVDFAALATVFGAYGERVEDPSGVLPAVKRALESGLPTVVDVVIDQDSHAPVIFKR